ncbi:30861_t:CDS:2 [Gigaspora margarita]|uniref:30861_t:CDS:1 n=1 Tax=Gigaspora margarita TaxID=4874 RepID=A0ABN7WK98_GIGMA|nr:30861_t:CDS:2 [Gigaspora margarita]
MSNQLSQTDTFLEEQNKTLKRKSSASNAFGDRVQGVKIEAHLVNICPGIPIEIKEYCKSHFQ